MPRTDIEAIVEAVVAELRAGGHLSEAGSAGTGAGSAPSSAVSGTTAAASTPPVDPDPTVPHIDLPDPSEPEQRYAVGVDDPIDPEGIANLRAATTARIAAGRSGPRPRTSSLLLFQGDHGVAQDAIYGTVDEDLLARFDLFRVGTEVTDQDTYLLRPDLGRRLSAEAKATIAERCVKGPQVQIVVGAGLSAAAVNNQLGQILPVITDGLRAAGISLGTPFFIDHARVGVMNDVGEATDAEAVLLLIGERPGLGVADALSAYMGYRPRAGKTDADRDLICMITDQGGTNPLEGGAYVVELLQQMLRHQASGVALRQATTGAES